MSALGAWLAWLLMAPASVVAAGAPTTSAAALELTLSLERADAQPVAVRVASWEIGSQQLEPRETQLIVRGSVGRLRLTSPPGVWRVRVTAPGYWPHEVTRAVAGEERLALSLKRSGRIAARLVAPPRTAVVTSVAVGFRGAGAVADAPTGSTDCPAVDGRLSCELPAGHWHLRFEAPGWTPVYRWDVEVPPGAVQTIGDLGLTAGASITGFVERLDGLRPGTRCRVSVLTLGGAPVAADADQAPGLRGPPRVELGAGVDARGFFQVRGVAAGEYRLVAEDGALASQPVDVVVKPGRETHVRAGLVLGEPSALDVSVSPATTPRGQAWRLALSRADGPTLRESASEAVARDGHARLSVSAGEYYLALHGEGQQWFGEFVRVSAQAGPLVIELPVLPLRGRILLGGRGLEARLRLSHPQGGAELLFESDAGGWFAGHVPAPGTWQAEVEYGDPPVVRAVQALTLAAAAGTSEAEVEIVLPATLLRGVVVDEDGAPVASANVRLQTEGPAPLEPSDTTTDVAGRFEVRGLDHGDLVLVAEAGGLRSDEVRVAWAPEAATLGDVRLVARPVARVRGQVVGDDGRPLAGAWLRASAAQNPLALAGSSLRQPADGDGRFDLTLAAGTRDAWLLVGVPGYALRLLRVSVPTPPGWAVGLSRASGNLAVELAAPWEPGPRQILIEHADARESLLTLFGFWSAPQGVTWDARRVVLPGLEPGLYRACSATLADYHAGHAGHDCQQGVVEAGRESTLKLR